MCDHGGKIMRTITAVVIVACLALFCGSSAAAGTPPAGEKTVIEKTIRDSIGWALTKDRPLLESVIAHDDRLFIFNPDSEITVGWDSFVKGFDFWMDPRFKATSLDIRDMRIDLSPEGDTAWWSCILDDLGEWDGRPVGWKDTRWTGVLEKRAGKWTIVQMHFSFASDRVAAEAGSDLQAQAVPDLKAKLQGVLDAFLAENPKAPGLAVTVICPEKGLDWTGTAGTVAHGDPAPVTSGHTFRIASNTKSYVAASVLRLAETGRLRLDDPVGKYLAPERIELLQSDGYDTDQITIAQLLSHTAGFGDHTNDSRFVEKVLASPHYPWTAEEQIRLLVEWRDPVGKPGEKFVYSDSGYVLLGTIVESLTGKKLGPAVRDLLRFDKLGLKSTYWEYMEEAPEAAGPRAHQYYGEQDVTGWTASFDLYGGGGIVSDSRELALFMRQLLKGKVFDKPETLEEMTGRGTLPYRLGLMTAECDGRLAIGHQGFWNTFAYHVPSLDLTVGGGVMNHDTTNGLQLVRRIVAVVASYREEAPRPVIKEAEETVEEHILPTGDVFRPLLADPKQPQFFVSLDRYKSPGEKYTMGEAGFGETFGIYRLSPRREGEDLQLSVEASLVARFNMETSSHDLVNADYSIGFPLTCRRGDNSLRLRFYHQSSHLGDEFLLMNPDHPERINLSYEAVEFLYSRQWQGMRTYIGGEYMIRRDPSDLEPASAHFGFDYLGSRKFYKRFRLIGGADFKSFEEHSWNIDTSLKFGFLFGSPDSGHRRMRLLAEWYRGHDPRGQFYINRVTYYGLNLSLGF
jgi:D-alanyl-D-alanine carboxypeptidase